MAYKGVYNILLWLKHKQAERRKYKRAVVLKWSTITSMNRFATEADQKQQHSRIHTVVDTQTMYKESYLVCAMDCLEQNDISASLLASSIVGYNGLPGRGTANLERWRRYSYYGHGDEKRTDEKESHLYSLHPLLCTVYERFVRFYGSQQERCLAEILTHHPAERSVCHNASTYSDRSSCST